MLRLVEAAECDPPAYLLAALGPRPQEEGDRQAWRVGAQTIESYRHAWSITDPLRPLGQRPDCEAQRRAFGAAERDLYGVQQRLAVDNSESLMRRQLTRPDDLDVGIA